MGRSNYFFLFTFLFILLPSFCGFSQGRIPFEINNYNSYRNVSSWVDIRDSCVVKQGFDYSCGSAALATLFRLRFNEEFSEPDIAEAILNGKTESEIKEIEVNGYSLLELKNIAEEKGCSVSIYRLPITSLYQLKSPVLIYFEPYGEKHFAVLKKVQGNKVYIADPARGNIRLDIFHFKKEWSGVIMAIDKYEK